MMWGMADFLYLYVTWQYALLCYRATGAIAPHYGFSGDSPDGKSAYAHWGSFTSSSRSVRRAIWFTWFSEPHDTTSLHACPIVQAVTHPIMNRARCCLTSVIEPMDSYRTYRHSSDTSGVRIVRLLGSYITCVTPCMHAYVVHSCSCVRLVCKRIRKVRQM